MRFSEVFAASLVAPLVAAHSGVPGAPKMFGLGPNPIAKLKSRNVFDRPIHSNIQAGPRLQGRQGGVDGQCGAAVGGASCAAGYCCSAAGWCGQGEEYCMAPDCQFEYGPACDANQTPSGSSTSNVARPQLGSIPYGGEGIYFCEKPGTVAITYDDGPYIYTNEVLDMFAAYGFKATFFITGININKGAIDNEANPWPAMIRRMIADGHQVASHTWSHQDLSAITQQQRRDQMIKNEMAIRNIIGKFPTYMRPPYSSCDAQSGCQNDMEDLGYVVSYFNLDTDDYNNVTPDKIQNAKDNFNDAIAPSNPSSDEFLAIAHDIHEQTARNLTAYMLDVLVSEGYQGVTMGECMNDPEANWYRSSSGNTVSSSAAPSSTRTGTATSRYTCIGFPEGSCCSQYGWCGSSTDHCGTGCQPLFGDCSGSSSSSRASSSSVRPSSTSTGSSSTPTPTGKTSVDGTCGGTSGYTCIGFSEGSCCSQYGWCGSTTGHCGAGCNPLFGTCNSSGSSSSAVRSSTRTSSTPAATPSGKYSCIGWSKGTCCSQYGWCGNTSGHCGTGCQSAFGTC
ncbi:glycoside hydrolase/deacetylase, partial [Lojkania enalia]